uniref:Uncharacterized protein n=1 Tax=Cacopsylla melanoneura TaxID=428564 RepID=A0A8D8TQM5_9HEMI
MLEQGIHTEVLSQDKGKVAKHSVEVPQRVLELFVPFVVVLFVASASAILAGYILMLELWLSRLLSGQSLSLPLLVVVLVALLQLLVPPELALLLFVLVKDPPFPWDLLPCLLLLLVRGLFGSETFLPHNQVQGGLVA